MSEEAFLEKVRGSGGGEGGEGWSRLYMSRASFFVKRVYGRPTGILSCTPAVHDRRCTPRVLIGRMATDSERLVFFDSNLIERVHEGVKKAPEQLEPRTSRHTFGPHGSNRVWIWIEAIRLRV